MLSKVSRLSLDQAKVSMLLIKIALSYLGFNLMTIKLSQPMVMANIQYTSLLST